jgi:hypothetical protein
MTAPLPPKPVNLPGEPPLTRMSNELTSLRASVNKLVPLHRGFDGFKVNGGLGGPRARPESQCCARRPGSAL